MCWEAQTGSGLTRSLHAVGLSGRQRVVYRSPADLHLLDVSRDDRVLLTRNNASRGMAALPPGSQREISISWLDWSFPVDLSDDGETVLFTEQGEGGGPRYATYLRPTRGGPALRIGEGQALDLSRDGTRVLIRPLDRDGVVLDVPVGAGDTVEIDTAGILVSYAYRLPDDDRLLLVGVREGGPVAGYVVHPGENTVERVTPEGVDTVSVQVSPDGRSVLARQPGRPYHLYPLDGGEPRKLEFLEVGDAPLGWSRNGRFLYVLDRNDPDSGVYRVDLQTAERIRVFTTGPTEPAGLTSLGPAFVTPDGKAYVYSYRRILSALYLAEGL